MEKNYILDILEVIFVPKWGRFIKMIIIGHPFIFLDTSFCNVIRNRKKECSTINGGRVWSVETRHKRSFSSIRTQKGSVRLYGDPLKYATTLVL